MTQGQNSLAGANKYADILFIQCPPWDTVMPPLGIAYLSAYLNEYGYKTAVFDLNVVLYNSVPQDLKYLWLQKSYSSWVDKDFIKNIWFQLKELATVSICQALQDVHTPCIGLSVNFASIGFAVELLKVVKYIKSDIKIILGGWGCIDEHMRSRFPENLVDVFVAGEGEQALKEAMDRLTGRKKPANIPGVIFTEDYLPVCKPRLPVMDLEVLPWPKFTEFQLDLYKYRQLPLLSSRGCIGNCSFCNDWSYSKPYRYRKASTVFEEIRYHKENNNINAFSFKDLLCNGNLDNLNSLADRIIDSKIEVFWDAQAISRKEMNYALLCKLKKSGCTTLIYGVESFSNNTLKKMNKLFTKEIAEKVIRDTSRAGIKVFINIIVGFPTETDKDFKETFEAINANRKYISNIGAISVCLINPNTNLSTRPKDYGLVSSFGQGMEIKDWLSAGDKNNYTIRKKRIEMIMDLTAQLGLSCMNITI